MLVESKGTYTMSWVWNYLSILSFLCFVFTFDFRLGSSECVVRKLCLERLTIRLCHKWKVQTIEVWSYMVIQPNHTLFSVMYTIIDYSRYSPHSADFTFSALPLQTNFILSGQPRVTASKQLWWSSAKPSARRTAGGAVAVVHSGRLSYGYIYKTHSFPMKNRGVGGTL